MGVDRYPIAPQPGGGEGGAVESVNGQVGAVELDAADVGAEPRRTIDVESYREGAMSDREVVAAACAAATSYSTVRLEPGRTYTLASTLAVDWASLTGVTLDGTDAVVTAPAVNGSIVRISGTWTDAVTTVSTAITAGDLTVTVVSGAGIAGGDCIAIRSSGEVFNPDRADEYLKGELLRVASVAGTTVTLVEPVRDSYSVTGNTVTVAVMEPVHDVQVRGLRVVGGGGTSQSAIYVRYFDGAAIVGCHASDSELHGILGERGFGLTISGCTAEDCAADGTGYGIRALAVQGVQLLHNTGRRNRHSFDVDAGTGGYPCRDVLYLGNSAEDDRASGISTHGASDLVEIAFNRTLRCGGGIIARGSNTKIVHNTVTGSKSLAQDAQSYRHGIYLGDDGAEHTWGVGLAGQGLVVADNLVDLTDGDWSGSDIAAGIFCTSTLVGARIERNTLIGHTSHGIYSKGEGGADVVIRDNAIDCTGQIGTPGSTQLHGIGLDPVAADAGLVFTRTRIESNRIVGALYSGILVAGGVDNTARTDALHVADNRVEDFGLRGVDLTSGYFGPEVVAERNVFPDATSILTAVALASPANFTRAAQVGGSQIGTGLASALFHGNEGPAFMRNNHYYVSAHSSAGAGTITDGHQWGTPFFVGRTLPVSTLAINVTTLAATTSIRLGIYRDIDDGIGGYPGALVAGSEVTVDASTTGFKTAAVDLDLEPGLYWLSAAAQGGSPQVTVLQNGTGQQIVGPNFGTTATARNGYRVTGVTGAFPSTFSTSVDAQGGAPAVHLRVG